MWRVLDKPCPICGSSAVLHVDYENMGMYLQKKFYVTCEGCGASTHIYEDDEDAVREFYSTKPEK